MTSARSFAGRVMTAPQFCEDSHALNTRFSASTRKEPVITGLPVVPFNQSKHSDVCQYLEYVQSLLLDIFKPEVNLNLLMLVTF